MFTMKRIKKVALTSLAVVTLAGGMAATEASAAGYRVDANARTYNFPGWDRLNMRAWPASRSRIKYRIRRNRTVRVKRCIIKSGTDWCLIHQAGKPWKRGWVSGRYIISGGQNFARPHRRAYAWH